VSCLQRNNTIAKRHELLGVRRPGYASYMAGEWRVSLIFDHHPGAREKSYSRTAIRDLLRSRFGDDIAVSAEKRRIFLYAGTADAAEEAEHVAREVLAQQNLGADFRLERWDPSGQAWRDAGAGAPDRAVAAVPAAYEDNPRQGRLRSAGALIGNVVQAVIDSIP
jgi:hypothetical protein